MSSSASGSLPMHASPVSSKRSRSRDSARSSVALSNNSANGSSAALSVKDTGHDGDAAQQGTDGIPLPWFLRQQRTDIHTKFQDLEWQQRNRLTQATPQTSGSPSQWARATGEQVLKRNRYMNVDPFLNNRVQLKVPEGHDPYINASPVVLKSSKTGESRNFIATQGPKQNTHAHVWRMVWHECASPAVMVMLTQTHESGREKCYPYFPTSLRSPTLVVNGTDEFGDAESLTVTLVSLTDDPGSRSTVRELELKNPAGQTKKVWHLLFEAWPDFGVPEEEDHRALLRLIPLSAEKNDGADQNSRIVHCSAGVGRSGTFIALDHLLGELDEGSLDEVPDGRDPIAETVESLRAQRMMMVQGEQQFALLYETLREKWVERWRRRNDGGGGGGGGGLADADFVVVNREEMREGEEGHREKKVAKLDCALESELRANAALAETL